MKLLSRDNKLEITRTHLGWIQNLLFNVAYKVFELLFIGWVGIWGLSIGSSRLQPLYFGANVASVLLPCHHWSDRSVCGVLLNINSYRGIRLGWHEQKHYFKRSLLADFHNLVHVLFAHVYWIKCLCWAVSIPTFLIFWIQRVCNHLRY